MHLGLAGFERKRQLKKFKKSHPFVGLHKKTPIIVAGDFNDLWASLKNELAPVGFESIPKNINTFPAYAPIRPLDSIFIRGDIKFADVSRSRLALAKRASDHLPLVARLEIQS